MRRLCIWKYIFPQNDLLHHIVLYPDWRKVWCKSWKERLHSCFQRCEEGLFQELSLVLCDDWIPEGNTIEKIIGCWSQRKLNTVPDVVGWWISKGFNGCFRWRTDLDQEASVKEYYMWELENNPLLFPIHAIRNSDMNSQEDPVGIPCTSTSWVFGS